VGLTGFSQMKLGEIPFYGNVGSRPSHFSTHRSSVFPLQDTFTSKLSQNSRGNMKRSPLGKSSVIINFLLLSRQPAPHSGVGLTEGFNNSHRTPAPLYFPRRNAPCARQGCWPHVWRDQFSRPKIDFQNKNIISSQICILPAFLD